MTSVRVCSVNVLFESFYQKYCKADVMDPSDRFRAFSKWAAEKLSHYDYVAMQEWPYGRETAKVWNEFLMSLREKTGFQILYDESCKQAGVLSVVSADCEVLAHRVYSLGRGKSYSQTLIKKNNIVIGLINAHVPFGRGKLSSFENISHIFDHLNTSTPHWIAVGDWNVEAVTPKDIKMLTEVALPTGFVDLTTEFPKTCAGDSKLSKFDYITISSSIKPVSAGSYPDVSVTVKHAAKYPRPHYSTWFSDHVAVEAALQIPE
eukprot:TRINITY_DN8189_c0_g1_i4.p1 TRINITY_DN8189_c0_g1~~TRINITY_DN8189_c0_g1_i4.p1  ORF type:complete len:272 (+),score=28.58 TRINITY_DN8189_c0_g1_i4:31-816(+)